MGSTHLPFEDVRRLLQLFRALEDTGPGTALRGARLIEVLCELVGATSGFIGLISDLAGGASGKVHDLAEAGFSSSGERAAVVEGLARQGCGADPAMRALLRRPIAPQAASRRELVDEAAWLASPYVAEIRRAAGVHDALYGISPGPDPQSAYGLWLYRQRSEPPFGAVERALLALFQQEAAAIYRSSLGARAGGAPSRLSPRESTTLERLAEGLSEKQIAAELGLSHHTVHDYVKSLYRHFGVSSRGALLACTLRARAAPRGEA
ncbi:response regulator transcription factor [Sorangium sp. So ce233]|uniref:helix-turn-helix transcriptional regulator n=1 Tax=Sorangium sp. So ce233 TaxID=3133290 RepID=UPI003F635C4F